MKQQRSFLKYTIISAFIAFNMLSTANATAVTGTHTMTFENSDPNPIGFLNSAGTLFSPFTLNFGSTSPGIGEYIVQDGVKTGAIGVGSAAPLDGIGTGHLHYAEGSGGAGTFGMGLENDTGGAAIYADGNSFSLQNTYFTFISDEARVTGYQSNGNTFSTLLSAGIVNSTINFLTLDSRFGDVTLVEFWFNATGRGALGPIGATLRYDDINIASPVPVPAAFYLFITGLIGLLGNKTRNYKT